MGRLESGVNIIGNVSGTPTNALTRNRDLTAFARSLRSSVSARRASSTSADSGYTSSTLEHALGNANRVWSSGCMRSSKNDPTLCAFLRHDPTGFVPHALNCVLNDATARFAASRAKDGRKRSGPALFLSRSAATAAARAGHGSGTADAWKPLRVAPVRRTARE
jgi:hypothetical protein